MLTAEHHGASCRQTACFIRGKEKIYPVLQTGKFRKAREMSSVFILVYIFSL